MNRKAIRLLSTALAAGMTVSFGALAAGCGKDDDEDPKGYTYRDTYITAPSTWNPHTYRTHDDAYVADFTTLGLYDFFFNDTYDGYEIRPEMAASEPVDVTATLKGDAKWGIPANADSGYAYTIDLNPDAKWDDGTPINADTYVYSMQQLLDPVLLNYRASNYYSGNLRIKNAENYFMSSKAGQTRYRSLTDLDFETVEEAQNAGFGPFWIDVSSSWGVNAADAKTPISNTLEDGEWIPITDTTLIYDHAYDVDGQAPADKDTNAEYWMSAKDIYEYLAENGGAGDYVYFADGVYPATAWEDVGFYKSGEYQFTIVLEKSLKGFYLLYSLGDPWIVKQDLYEAAKNGGEAYNTSVTSSSSFGPYKLTKYIASQVMEFERNENWYGWTDGKHEGLYQTTKIVSKCIAEASTRKQMFLKGELEKYDLQADDYAEYRSSDHAYEEKGQTVFFLILCGDEEALAKRETTGVQKRILSLESFRKAMAVTYQKDLFASTISPSRSGAYGLIGKQDIWNVDKGTTYRSTDEAKKVLCDFYGIDVNHYGSLDEAVKAITGYDPELASQLFKEAFDYAEKNFGMKSTDIVQIEYASSATSSFITKTIDYLNTELDKVLEKAGLKGRVKIVESAPYGNEWSTKIRTAASDTVLAGWTGGLLDPFSTIQYYTNPKFQPYCDQWYNTTTTMLSLTLDGYNNGNAITMSLKNWGECLNGQQITVGGTGYNFGYGMVPDETRLAILAGMEGKILSSYSYIPMLQDGSFYLLSQKVRYVTKEYNAVLGYGGIKYTQYKYNDGDWKAYVKQQGGTLSYK